MKETGSSFGTGNICSILNVSLYANTFHIDWMCLPNWIYTLWFLFHIKYVFLFLYYEDENQERNVWAQSVSITGRMNNDKNAKMKTIKIKKRMTTKNSKCRKEKNISKITKNENHVQ